MQNVWSYGLDVLAKHGEPLRCCPPSALAGLFVLAPPLGLFLHRSFRKLRCMLSSLSLRRWAWPPLGVLQSDGDGGGGGGGGEGGKGAG
eukprot:1954397-Pleurochrysis_carterae.AAC.1